jgi:D-alanyl-D-alanine carboxypeptidase (penicillin-binding protein 5/6)
LRGLFTRFFSMVLGAGIALALVVGMQVPLLHQPATSRLTLRTGQVYTGSPPPLAWPSEGNAALIIPSLGVATGWHDSVAPIASLTKMMTAYVTLKRLPLVPGATGPCVTITTGDVATYEEMKLTGQSSVAVTEGESLCEIDLLEGLLVHSANNFAVLLATMVSGSQSSFVALMNQTAMRLGLVRTTYVEPTGYEDGNVSTALEQGKLAVLLMKSPLVRSIVVQPSVTLPFAGTVSSFTPFVGTNNVIGVKSGRTYAAGGCDVLAMTFQQGDATKVVYAIVLGQRGGDLLGPAGVAALALATSAVGNQLVATFNEGQQVGTVGWGTHRTAFTFASTHELFFWSKRRLPEFVHLAMKRLTGPIHRGEVVGWLELRGTVARRYALVATRSVSPLSLWQRLR